MRRRAIVTGASSGIGKATAVRLASAGYAVGVTWRSDADGARHALAEIEAVGEHAVRHLDLDDPADGARVVDALADDLGGLDVLVANAGRGDSQPFLEVDLDRWRQVMRVDLDGSFVTLQAAARRMVAQGSGGRLIAVTSVHEHVPLAGSSAYCAAKGGLGLLVKVAALELAEHAITVNSVAPGEIATKMTDQHDVDPHTERRPGVPAGRPGHADEVAATIAFLASSEASYVTGASLVVDGGLTLMAAEANRALAPDRTSRRAVG